MSLGLLLIAGAAVSGCSTTQDEAARLQLNSARIRAAEVRTVVRTAGARLRVTTGVEVSPTSANGWVGRPKVRLIV
jgi:hypothetical protein